MEEEVKKLKRLIDSSERILVVSHISPDPDSICSILLCGRTLSSNFPDKEVVMSAEELTGGLNFLPGYDLIKVKPLADLVNDFLPQLIIMLDAMNFRRCSYQQAQKVSEIVAQKGIKLAIIDHHEPVEVEANQVYINQKSPATVQDVYEVLFDHLKYQKPTDYAETAMVGLLSDTARFLYENPRHRQTFKIVDDLIDEGVSIESLENRATRYTRGEMRVIGELIKNLQYESGFTYSYIGDDFTEKWVESGSSTDELKLGCEVFVSGYIRNIEQNNWGFIVYPDLNAGEGRYSASFRALGSIKDVSEIARKLGGGGHKPAAGAKLATDSVDAAVRYIKREITEA